MTANLAFGEVGQHWIITEGKQVTHVEKDPVKTTAPPILVRSGKLTVESALLSVTCNAPPIDCRSGIDRPKPVKAVLEIIAKLPAPVAVFPTESNVGAEKSVKEFP